MPGFEPGKLRLYAPPRNVADLGSTPAGFLLQGMYNFASEFDIISDPDAMGGVPGASSETEKPE